MTIMPGIDEDRLLAIRPEQCYICLTDTTRPDSDPTVSYGLAKLCAKHHGVEELISNDQ